MLSTQTILFALGGGLLPALLWLFFWLKEDSKHPEPRIYIAFTFIFGMLSVVAALIIQQMISPFLLGSISMRELVGEHQVTIGLTMAIIIFSFIEEIVKFLAAYFVCLKRRKIDNEPLDDVVYMITAALGFVAVENTLFLLGPLLAGDAALAVITGNMRFIGATVLHVASSSIIGVFLAFSHFKLKRVKFRYLWSGIILATGLHAGFNLFIMRSTDTMLYAFAGVWLVSVLIIFLFEKIKRIKLEQIES